MKRTPKMRLATSLLALASFAGCASIDIDGSLDRANSDAAGFTDGRLALARTAQERAAQAVEADQILASPLGQREAVRLALVNSPALQAMLANRWADGSAAAQAGRIANPLFAFSRLRIGAELELERTLSFGLLDLLLLPQRYGIATRRIEENQLRLTAEVVEQVTTVRQDWVRAVAAKESLTFARRVLESAEASAELARRMQVVGNFNRLDRARQQVFYADAATQLATAQHLAVAAREKLARGLGLTEPQAESLTLPERLPDLPDSPRAPDSVARSATDQRLDVRMAEAAFATAAKAQGLERIQSLTDIELGVRRDTTFDNDSGTRTSGRGFEVSVSLPLFDWGGLKRDQMNARTLALVNRLEATLRAAASHLRENYSSYRTSYDIATHYRDEVVPLRKLIAEENGLRYNGMQIGIFELLADSRNQIGSVIAAIAANRQFWLSDAALQATLIGSPVMSDVAPMAGTGMSAGAAEAAH